MNADWNCAALNSNRLSETLSGEKGEMCLLLPPAHKGKVSKSVDECGVFLLTRNS